MSFLSAEGRAAGARNQVAARQRRAEVKRGLQDGSITMVDVFDMADAGEEAIRRMRVVEMLQAMPHVGAARRTMAQLGIDETRRIRGLGPRQRAALIERF